MPTHLGEFEQHLLLAILRLGGEAYGVNIACELETQADRKVSRGALYATLDRLERKGLVRWKAESGAAARRGLPRRAYTVSAGGRAALRESRDRLHRLWRGVEHLLKGPAA
jgi:PadR family transcriptional regulator, regulatory protein PadR